jgi:hypothetical protein
MVATMAILKSKESRSRTVASSQPTSHSSTVTSGSSRDGRPSTVDCSTPGDSAYGYVEPSGSPNIPAVHRVPEFCTCPISLDCQSKGEHYIDCRTLTLEWKEWNPRTRAIMLRNGSIVRAPMTSTDTGSSLRKMIPRSSLRKSACETTSS